MKMPILKLEKVTYGLLQIWNSIIEAKSNEDESFRNLLKNFNNAGISNLEIQLYNKFSEDDNFMSRVRGNKIPLLNIELVEGNYIFKVSEFDYYSEYPELNDLFKAMFDAYSYPKDTEETGAMIKYKAQLIVSNLRSNESYSNKIELLGLSPVFKVTYNESTDRFSVNVAWNDSSIPMQQTDLEL